MRPLHADIFDEQVAPLVMRMPLVQSYAAELGELKGRWDTLTLLAQLSGLKLETQGTRDAFAELSAAMLNRLAVETFAHASQGLEQKATAALDVLTRNLFERTADIGFLSTDDAIVEFCRLHNAGERPEAGALTERFAQYVRKYSVYKNVVLFDTQGRLLASLAPCAVERSEAPLIAAAVHSAGYVETFAAVDFLPGEISLTYAARVCAAGSPVGVLVLVFDVHTEAAAIFRSLASEDEVLVFMDREERVLLSSEPFVVPVGAKVPPLGRGQQIKLAARRLIAAKARPLSYQGYGGPGWSAMAAVPVDEAFAAQPAEETVQLAGERLFSEQLLSIPRQAEHIQQRLQQLVWNGRLQQDTANSDFARALLHEIASVGGATRHVFDSAIRHLQSVAVAGIRDEAESAARRAADILDRNLYERACDSRWWALTPALIDGDAPACAAILRGINDLYTVYTDLLLFDKQGRILATSRSPHLEGQTIDAEWVQRALGTPHADAYAVSRFESSPLYGDRPTYIYGAALRSGNDAVRGIAIVFDAGPQFDAMLRATLPRQEGVTAAFVLGDGTVLSRTGPAALPFPPEALALNPGEGYSCLVECDGRHYAIGASAGAGYREFKQSDGYRETVVAIVVVPCGPAADAPAAAAPLPDAATNSHGTEVALFKVAGEWLAATVEDIEGCVRIDRAARMPVQPVEGAVRLGMTLSGGNSLTFVDLAEAPPESYRGHFAVVLRYGTERLAVLCDDLGPVCHAPVHPAGIGSGDTAVAKIGTAFVPMLSVKRLWRRAGMTAAEPAAV